MAVYTEVTDEELTAFIADYDVGELMSCKGIAEGVENSNFLIHTETAPYILTLYEKRVDPDDLPFFLGLMEHLAARGITCPLPVHDRQGRVLRTLAGRPAAMVTFLEGFWLRHPQPHHCHAVGAALAGMHLAGRDFTLRRENALGLAGWRPLFERFASRADEISPGLGATIAAEIDHLEQHWPRDLPDGVIHADLFPDNVFFLHDALSGLIDFYFACNDAFAYDLAVSLNAWCFEADGSFHRANGAAMIAGYESVRDLTTAERAVLPLLARGSALRFLLTRAYDWLNTPKTALVRPHDPLVFLQRLGFHQAVVDASAYGAEWDP
jgi:homoserine kinase type II